MPRVLEMAPREISRAPGSEACEDHPERGGRHALRRISLRHGFFLWKLLEECGVRLARPPACAFASTAGQVAMFLVHRGVLASLRSLPAVGVSEACGTRTGLGVHQERSLVVRCDPRWPQLYEEESRLVADVLGAGCAEIHHVGSTAVPGLDAKPIIDMAVALRAEDFESGLGQTLAGLEKIGYRHVRSRPALGFHYLEKGFLPVRTHAIQLHRSGGRQLSRLLRFRDRLRSDPSLARDYGRLKASLAHFCADDRWMYAWYKGHWVNGLLLEDTGFRAWGRWLVESPPRSLCRMLRLRAASRRLDGPLSDLAAVEQPHWAAAEEKDRQ